MPYLDNPAVEPLHAANVGMAESDAEQNQEVEQKAVKVAISGYGVRVGAAL